MLKIVLIKNMSKKEKSLEIAAQQLINDKIDILHTIGGDDTNTTAADLSNFLKKITTICKLLAYLKL